MIRNATEYALFQSIPQVLRHGEHSSLRLFHSFFTHLDDLFDRCEGRDRRDRVILDVASSVFCADASEHLPHRHAACLADHHRDQRAEENDIGGNAGSQSGDHRDYKRGERDGDGDDSSLGLHQNGSPFADVPPRVALSAQITTT